MHVILTGHGEFASGLLNSLRMISGEITNISTVLFNDNQSAQEYRELLKTEIQDVESNEILILTDLLGGSPFQTASALSVESEKEISVISGTNLGMLLEAALICSTTDDLPLVAKQVLEVGTSQITTFQNQTYIKNENKESLQNGI